MKTKEQKVFGVCSIILASFGVVGAGIPFINIATFFTGVIALMLGAVGIIVNKDSKKTLSIIGGALALVALVFALVARVAYTDRVENYLLQSSKAINRNDDTIQNYKSQAKQKKEIVNKLQPIISKADFKLDSDSDDYKIYKASIKNTTGTNLAYFSCPVYLRDSSGKRISTEYISCSDWENGDTVEFTFEPSVDFLTYKTGTPSITLETEEAY
ncbi:hypothetical protein OGZ37_09570 [Lactococcus lactis]|uniref:hypothetical protein n=1 Tax=Lactococcus lactis TaxID=1358 RepID=UPI0024185111|nr:hypothetical protein [Lactococcus lactis]MDG4966819.1 hypothetical protein [Lactococcus lactis]